MLITTCTQCLARFRVTPQQLNAKQGQVRCGRCGKVFSGFEALERVPDDDTGSRLLAAREAADAKNMPPQRPHVSEELPELEAIDASAVPAAPAQAEPPPAAAAPRRPSTTVVDLPLDEPPARPSRAWSFGVALLLLVIGC